MKGPIKLSEYIEPSVIALVYGNMGVGKTIFACGSKSMRVLLLDIDKGAFSAKCSNLVNDDLITLWQINSYDEFI